MNMSRFAAFALALIMLFTCATCFAEEEAENMKVTRLMDYVLDAGCYTELDYESAKAAVAEQCDLWGGLCSAVAVNTADGQTLVGRNMDLFISFKPAYVIRTKVEGCYETLGLSYFHTTGPDYEDALENGVPDTYAKILPFICTDILNSEGLYIETNMRNGEYNEDGSSRFGCSGTNPDSDQRICSMMLPRYIAEHCATVDEALEFAKTLDIYTTNSASLDWNFCFMMADATGHYGLLEIAQNKLSWLDGQQGQANFYITEEFAQIEEKGAGYGRYDRMMEQIDSVQSEADMLNVMNSVTYFQLYSGHDCGFDWRSELVGSYDGWTSAFVLDESNREVLEAELMRINGIVSSETREQLQQKCTNWESVFTNIANCQNRTLTARFFEDDTRTITLGFED